VKLKILLLAKGSPCGDKEGKETSNAAAIFA
jgi:hypothetical protein